MLAESSVAPWTILYLRFAPRTGCLTEWAELDLLFGVDGRLWAWSRHSSVLGLVDDMTRAGSPMETRHLNTLNSYLSASFSHVIYSKSPRRLRQTLNSSSGLISWRGNNELSTLRELAAAENAICFLFVLPVARTTPELMYILNSDDLRTDKCQNALREWPEYEGTAQLAR